MAAYEPLAAAAARLGLSQPRLRALCAAGEVPGAMRFGARNWAVPVDFYRAPQKRGPKPKPK